MAITVYCYMRSSAVFWVCFSHSRRRGESINNSFSKLFRGFDAFVALGRRLIRVFISLEINHNPATCPARFNNTPVSISDRLPPTLIPHCDVRLLTPASQPPLPRCLPSLPLLPSLPSLPNFTYFDVSFIIQLSSPCVSVSFLLLLFCHL